MMMGHGYYDHGESSFCSSNLSALAPPFTVTATGPKPVTIPVLVDLNEPNYDLHNWINHDPHPPSSGLDYFPVPNSDFGPVPSSNTFRYSPSVINVSSNARASPSADAALYGQTSIGLVEAEPYYPSYVSPSIGDDSPLVVPHQSGYDLLSAPHLPASNGSSHDDYAQKYSDLEHMNHWGSGSGWWEGITDWKQSEPVELDDSYCSKGNYKKEGTEACIEIGSAVNLDYKSILDENLKFGPSTYATTSTWTSTKVTPNTYSQSPFQKAVSSRNQKNPYVTSFNNRSRRHDESPNTSRAATKSLPPVVIRAPVEDTCLFKNTSDGDDVHLAGNDSSAVEEPQPFKGFEGTASINANQLSFNLAQDDHIEEFPGTNNPGVDSLLQIFRATAEIKSPHTIMDCSNSAGFSGEGFNYVEDCSESLNHYHSAVDSPCWKQAPFSKWSPSQDSEVVTSQGVSSFNGKHDQGSQNPSLVVKDTVEVIPEKESENSTPPCGSSLNYCQGSFSKKDSVAKMLFKEGTDGTVGSAQHITEPRFFHDVKISYKIHEPGKANVLSNISVPTCDVKPPYSEQRSLDEGKWMSDKNCAPWVNVADDRTNINDEADGCSSHVPFRAVEHVLCSPPSTEDTLSKLIKSEGSMPTRYAHILVNTMHNLSELFQFHCSNNACELKKEDCEVVKDVINKLNMCLLKNVERKVSTQEPNVPHSINSLERSPELHQDMNVNSLPVFRVDAAKFPDPGKCPQLQDEHDLTHAKYEKFSNFASASVATNVQKDDKMTQDIKKVLAESFQDEEETQPQILLYKNLWLEAEASLCLANSMARFNQIKIETGTSNVPKANDLPENTVVMENLSRSKVISDLFSTSTIKAGNKNDPLQYSCFPDSSICATSGHADDVMARFHILKSRVDNTSSVDTSAAEKLPGSKLSTESQTDKLTHEPVDAAKQNTSFVDTSAAEKFPGSKLSTWSQTDRLAHEAVDKAAKPNTSSVDTSAAEKLPGSKPSTESQTDKLTHEAVDIAAKLETLFTSSTTNPADDVEASVLARFKILQHRDDNSSTVNMEMHQPEGIDFRHAGEGTFPSISTPALKNNFLDVNMEPVLQNIASNSEKNKSTMKEFQLFVDDDPVVQSCMTFGPGDHLHPVWCDTSSSDWEHILKDEFTCKNG